jgi:cytochrome c oxidase cbb3-type subunit 1
LVLVGLGLGWLAAGLGLALIASVKLVVPGLLADCAWLSYGRIQPAAWNALVYGFGAQVGLGVGLWLVCRLSGAPLIGRAAVVLAALCWNIGLKIGIFGILIGDSTGRETLELPAYASPVLFCAYVCVAVCAALTFHARRERELYISQWYILGALLGFPWLYSAASLLAVFAPLRGVLQAAVQAWYAHNLFTVWLTFIGLAALFYFIPKLAGAPIPSRRLAVVGFWTLALFGSLGGLQRYAGGPFPAWLLGVSVVAGVCTLVPVLAVVVNLAGALRNRAGQPKPHPAWRFVLFAFCAYALGGLLAVANALPPVRRITHFTLFSTALEQLALQGFVAMALSGALYFIVPRLLACDWPSARAIRAHFGGAAAGVGLSFLALGLGGVLQGWALDDPAIAFNVVVERCGPYLLAAALANALLWLGGLAVTVHFLWLLGRCWRARCLPVAREWFREQPAAEEIEA